LENYIISIMSTIRHFTKLSMHRVIASAGESCKLHRLYKISFDTGQKYIGQTKKMPEERFKEHMRASSKCTLLKNALEINKAPVLSTLAITGAHQIDIMERVAIAMEDSVSKPSGLNICVGGPGVKRPDSKYYKFRNDVALVKSLLDKKHFVSYDILFLRGDISLTEEEFNAVKILSS
jgi:hypothetical protein